MIELAQNMINDSRLTISPKTEIKTDSLKSILPDGTVVKAELEFIEQTIKLGNFTYNVFVGSTAGKKGLPNQDFAGLGQRTISIANQEWDCLLSMVTDGVSSRENSEETSKSIVENTIENFSKISKKYNTFEVLSEDLWYWISQGAKNSQAPNGVSTVSAFLLCISDEETKGIALNCGDSRVYWATQRYVDSAKVHADITNNGAITYSLGADRDNEKIYKDIYFIDDNIPVVFLCTDTFAYRHDGVHFPQEMIPAFGRGIGSLNDHLTAISIKKQAS